MGSISGRIVKALSGFYYVHTKEGTFACRAKGRFRKDEIHPLVGDMVTIDITDTKDMEGNVVEIRERSSMLLRPPVANVDQALVVFAIRSPDINHNRLTRYLVALEISGVRPALAFTKTDLVSEEEKEDALSIYGATGYPIFFVSSKEETGIDEVRDFLKGKLTTLAGPSGAGKSSLVNSLLGTAAAVTGEVSGRTGRGKQTTRHTELFSIGDGAYIFDTPGFTAIDTAGIEAGELSRYFPEMREHEKLCHFRSCMHINEPDCGVKQAVLEGSISKKRYDDYVIICEELLNNRRF